MPRCVSGIFANLGEKLIEFVGYNCQVFGISWSSFVFGRNGAINDLPITTVIREYLWRKWQFSRFLALALNKWSNIYKITEVKLNCTKQMNKMKTFLTDSLPEVCSTQRSCKKVLYLHFNCIARLAEIKNLRAIRNKFRGHSWLFRHWRKSWPLLQDYFGSRIRAVVAVAVVDRFEQKPLYELSARTRKWPL